MNGTWQTSKSYSLVKGTDPSYTEDSRLAFNNSFSIVFSAVFSFICCELPLAARGWPNITKHNFESKWKKHKTTTRKWPWSACVSVYEIYESFDKFYKFYTRGQTLRGKMWLGSSSMRLHLKYYKSEFSFVVVYQLKQWYPCLCATGWCITIWHGRREEQGRIKRDAEEGLGACGGIVGADLFALEEGPVWLINVDLFPKRWRGRETINVLSGRKSQLQIELI